MNGHSTVWNSLWHDLPLRSLDLVDLLRGQICHDTKIGLL